MRRLTAVGSLLSFCIASAGPFDDAESKLPIPEAEHKVKERPARSFVCRYPTSTAFPARSPARGTTCGLFGP